MKKALSLLLVLVMLVGMMPGLTINAFTAEQTATNELEGKTISILGASMSTYTGISNNPDYNSTIGNNAVYYTEGKLGVYKNDTWWMQAANDLGLELLVNNSWSGSSLLYERNGTVGAYVDRCVQLHNNEGEMPDIIAIQMGTNDFQYYKDTLGTADIDYAALITENEDGSFTYAEPTTSLEAAAIVLHKISIRYPNAEVYYLNISQRIDGTDELIRSFNAELKQVVEHFGAHIVDIYGSAITMADFDTYIGDGRVHPNCLGMDAYTEAFKRALLANTAYEVDTHTVSLDLDGVTADYGDDKIVVSGDAFSCTLTAEDGKELSVSVTMGGEDITDTAYENGTVSIESVTDDVVIAAEATVHQSQNYRWEFDGTDLACVSGGNTLTKNSGTTTDGVFNKTSYTLENEVVLMHDLPWIVEWKCEGTFLNTNGSSGARIFTSDNVNANYNARYIFKSNTNGIIAMGEKDTNGSHNYGIALADHGIDWTELHTYRLENRIAADGSNMIYLLVDGKEIGPMNHYYIGTKDQNTTTDWLSGKDFVFPYMGTDTHGFTNASIEFIQVWESGKPETEENLWDGRSAVFVGDSITAGTGTTKLYYQFLEETLGFGSVTAMGVAGSCISAYSDYGTSNQPLINRYQNIPSADMIVIFMGTNDYGHETPLGYMEDTQDGTFYGALNTIIPDLVAKHPSSKIVFVTPLHRYGFGTSKILETAFTYDSIPNGVGASLGDYVYALKTVCANNGVSVIDLYTECTLDPSDAEARAAYMPDGLHPNAAGHEVIAGIMESHIRGYEPVEGEPIVQTELIHGNKFAAGNNQSCRASSRINYYLKAGTVITLKNADVMQWACTKTSDENSSSNLGYFPDSGWSDKETAVVAADGWIGFTFKYRDETQSFDLTKPLSDYITIEEPHVHSYTSTVTAPTCTEQGYTTYTCECGESYVDDYVNAEGHKRTNGICTVCGDSFAGKKVSILSHSMSTYAGVSNNTAANSTIGSNDVYYTEGRLGVYQKDTWWQQVIDALDMELLVNNSWSGSCVFMPRKGEASVGYGDRAVNLHNDYTGEEPDIIFVYLGCNDFAYFKDTFGEAADVDYTSLITDNGDGTFIYATPTTTCEAYAIMLHKAAHRYPNAEIYCMTSTARRETDYTGDSYPDAGQPTAYSAELQKIAQYFGYPVIDLENAIPKDVEIFDKYIGDKRAHANALGMDQISNEVLSVMLGTEAEICHVTSEDGIVAEQALLLGGSYSADVTLRPGYSIKVTMDGKDITSEAYQNGKITITKVTGDICVRAYIVHTPKDYLWNLENGELVSTGEYENNATKLSGTVTDGLLSNSCYAFSTAIVLQHDLPWVLEWKIAGNWGGMLLSSTHTEKTANIQYITRTKSGQVCFGTWLEEKHRNYGVDLSALDNNAHVYRLENHIAADGSNMIWIYVDGTEIGPMNNYYIGSAYQSTDSAWVSGRDFVFSHVGTGGYPLNNCALDYMRVIECNHTYENGTCTACDAEHPNLANYEGKVISILGDSISTFAGYIPTADGFNLEHYARYPQDNLFTEVEHTWWMQVLTALDAKLGINESWRSTEVYNYIDAEVNSSYDGTKACMASVTRIQNLGSNGTPDVILFFGGTNDITQRRPVGSFDPATAPTEVDLISVKWDTVADAYVDAIMRMQHYYPNAEIVAMLPTFTYKNTDAVIEAYNSVFAAICEHYGVTYVDLRECGISTSDLPDGTHPNATGMDYITAAVMDVLMSDCDVEAGEHIVHSVTHNLTGAESSLSYYKGISHGNSFVTTITGENLKVTVTMGGTNITADCYTDGVVSIEKVTGDIVITAKGIQKTIFDDYLQELPENLCSGTNLWTELKPINLYYTTSGWGLNASGSAYSITIPISEGDQIWATSFQKSGTNGGTGNGIRLTWFDADGVLRSLSPTETYAEFIANGYLTAPEGAVAVNVVMWNGNESNEVYILNRDHCYENGICTGCGAEHPNLANYEGKVISILGGSTCTFDGYIPVADGFNLTHRPRYPQSNLLTDVNDTWWMQVVAELDAKLGINDSWAGSQVLNTLDSNSGDLGPDAAMASLTRIQNLGANGTPDIILFYGAMNDIGRGVSLGSFDAGTAPSQADLTATKWSNLADAYVAAILRMQHYYPNAEIVAMLPGPTASYYTEAERKAYCEVLKAICDHYGVPTVDLSTCGLTTDDMPDGTHPNAEGMDYITAAVLDTLLNECHMEADENMVHSVTHELTGAKSTLSYYKGVSDGKSFATTITGEDVTVTVTMGGVDITDQVYANGKISISAVTGDVVITAKGAYNADGRLQQLPENYCYNTNLWTVLNPVNEYYTASGWGNNSNSNYSVTFLVTPGDQIWATSFGAAGTNGYSANAVRITWFDENGVLKSLGRDAVYAEFAKNGYITVPEGATAVNIPMASDADTWEIYILNRDHTYENGICTACGAAQPGPVITQQPVDGEAKLGERYMVEVLAEGEGLTYQWYGRNAGSKSWFKSSVKDNTYDDVMTEARAGREVYCIITDANGNSVKTDTVKLICVPSEELEIVTQPTDGEAVLGERFCITVEAKGESLKYQWYFRNKGATRWTKSSVTDSTYDAVMTTTRDGREVYCVITDLAGNKITTDIVKLVRVPMKLEITSQPTDATAAFGETFCATVVAKGEGLKYQWYYRNAGSSVWHKSGVRDNTYDDVMTKARNGREIYCVITDRWGNSVTTDTVKLIAVPSVELKLLGVSYEGAAMGERFCVTVNAQGDGLTYTWYFRNAGATRWSKSGVTDNTYDDVMNKTRANREVYCVITDAFGNQIVTDAVTLEVDK